MNAIIVAVDGNLVKVAHYSKLRHTQVRNLLGVLTPGSQLHLAAGLDVDTGLTVLMGAKRKGNERPAPLAKSDYSRFAFPCDRIIKCLSAHEDGAHIQIEENPSKGE